MGVYDTHTAGQVQGERGNPIRPAKPSTKTQEAPGSRALTGEEPDSRLGLPRPYFKAGVACLAMTKPIKETNRDGEKSVARSKAPATS